MENLFDEIAKQSLTDYLENKVDIPDDRLSDAKDYAKEASFDLDSVSTYNPLKDSIHLSKRCAIIYVKLRLAGIEPNSDDRYIRSVKQWERRAAIEYHTTKKIQLDRDPKYKKTRHAPDYYDNI